MVDFYIVACDYIVFISPWMSFVAFELYVGHRSVVFICRSAVVEHFDCKWPLYSVTANRAWENCLCQGRTEEHQTKQMDMDCLPSENTKTFWKKVSLLMVELLYVVCVVSHRCPTWYLWFMASCRNTVGGCWFFQISSIYSIISWTCIASLEANNRRLLFYVLRYILKY